ncbi:hypothetical protein ACF5F0_003369, partial [Salmonella enterica]
MRRIAMTGRFRWPELVNEPRRKADLSGSAFLFVLTLVLFNLMVFSAFPFIVATDNMLSATLPAFYFLSSLSNKTSYSIFIGEFYV